MATVTVYAHLGDGYIQSIDATYAAARAGTGASLNAVDSSILMYVGQHLDAAPDYNVWEDFLAFGAVGIVGVTAASLSLWGTHDNSDTDFDVEVHAQAWGGTLETTDFVPGANLGTPAASLNTSGWAVGSYNVISGLASIINTGPTELLVASGRTRAGTAPTGIEYVGFYCADNSGTIEDPKLTITGDIAYPVVASWAGTQSTDGSGGVACTMPAGIAAGDLLIAIAANDKVSAPALSASAGWSELFEVDSGGQVAVAVYAKIAAGGDTLTVTGANQDVAVMVLRITDHGVANVATDIAIANVAGDSDTPDPPSLNTGVSKKYLWLELFGADDDDEAAAFWSSTFSPLGQVESAQSASACMVAGAYAYGEQASMDPGAMALGAVEEWVATTIAIPPGAAGPTFDVSFAATVPVATLAATVATGTGVAFAGTVPMPALAATVTHTPPPTFDVAFAATVPLATLAATVDIGTGVAFAGTVPVATLAATVTHTPPTFDASFAATVPVATLAATVTHTPPTFDASFAATVPIQTLAAVLSTTVADFTVDFAGTVPMAALAATVATGTGVAFAGTIPMAALAATVDHTPPTFDVSFAATVPVATLAATVATEPSFAVSFAATVPLATLAATVTHTPPTFDASFAGTVPVPALAATVATGTPTRTVTFAATVPMPSLAATVATTRPMFPVSFAATIPMITSHLTGSPDMVLVAGTRAMVMMAATRAFDRTAAPRPMDFTADGGGG